MANELNDVLLIWICRNFDKFHENRYIKQEFYVVLLTETKW